MRLYGKFPALQGEISVVDSELALLSYKRKQILTTNLTETRDLGNEGQPYQPYLRAIRGVARGERMRNEDIGQEVKVVELREKIRESRMRWYVKPRKEEDEFVVRWSAERRETGTRNRGRRRKRWMDCV